MTNKPPITLAVIALLLLAVLPAAAITYGQPDGDLHPNVGILGASFADGPAAFCSGTLIAQGVFLTAGHCVAFLPAEGVAGVYKTSGRDDAAAEKGYPF